MPTQSSKSSRTGMLLILGAAMLWGTTGTSQALAPQGVRPESLGALRLAVGGAVLLLLALRRREFGSLKEWRLLPVLFGGGCVALYQLTFFAGVGRTGVAVGTMVAIGSSPVAAGILDYLVRGERPGRKWMVSTLLAVTGCSLLGFGGKIAADPVGILLAVAAGASYAVYALAIKSLLARKSADAVMAVVFCTGAVCLAPFLAGADLSWAMEPRGVVVVLHLGVVATALSYQLFARGLLRIPVSTAVTLSLAEPLTAAVLGVVLVGERVTATSGIGMLLIFFGLALLSFSFDRKHRVVDPDEKG